MIVYGVISEIICSARTGIQGFIIIDKMGRSHTLAIS